MKALNRFRPVSLFQNAPAQGAAAAAPRVSAALSDQIKVARVLCIFFMIYVHVNPGSAAFEPAVHGVRAFDWIRLWIADSAGRASIGLLSIVSGFLAARAVAVTPYGRLVAKRIRSLVIPMALWSAAFLGFVLLGEAVSPGYFVQTFGRDFGLSGLPNWLFGLSGEPANGPLAFLRDVFVCALLSPLLAAGLRFSAPLMLAGLFAVMVGPVSIDLLVSANILFFFTLGLAFGRKGYAPARFGPAFTALVWAAFILGGGLLAWGEVQLALGRGEAWAGLHAAGYDVLRLAAAPAAWMAAGWLSRSSAGARVRAAEPYVFIAFCSHLIVTTAVWFVWQKLFGGYYGALYPVFFALGPVIAFAGAFTIVEIAARVWPDGLKWINGGRGAPRPETQPANGAKVSATAS